MMKSRLLQGLLLAALSLLVVQVVLIAPRQIRNESAQEEARRKTPEASSGGQQTDQSMQGMHMIETQEGRKEWELWSEAASSIRDQDRLELNEVKALFFSDTGTTFTVTGKKGIVQTKSKNMRVEGDVVTRSSNGYVFKTDSLDYDSMARELTTPSAVQMFGPQDGQGHSLKLVGSGMKADMNASSMEVLREVKAEKTVDKSKKAFIRSHSALFSGEHKRANFKGDVVLDMESMRITGPEAQFDYDGKKDILKSVYFSGGAKVSDTDKWATSQNLKVDFESNKFIFRGSPRVVQNNDELRGEEIVFLDGGKRVQVQRARARVDEKRMEKAN